MAMTSRMRTLAGLVVVLFAYANLLCAIGGAAVEACEHRDAHSHCDGAESAHHNGVPTQQSKDCSKDSCFCLTMNTVVTQQTVTKPNHTSLRVVDLTFVQFSNVMPVVRAVVAYEHGPPSIAPPSYLSGKSLSPRAPPSA